MHGVREDILRAQADAAGLPLFTIPLPVAVHERDLRGAAARRGRPGRRATASRTSPSAICFSRMSGSIGRIGWREPG